MLRNHSATTLFVFILSPLLALPLIVYGIYYQKKNAFVLLAVFMGLMAYLTAPSGDLYRHTFDHFVMQRISWQSFSSSLEHDYVMQILSYILGVLGIPYEYLRFSYVTISYLIVNYIYNIYISQSTDVLSKKELLIKYLIVFSSLKFFMIACGVRWGFAVCIFVLGFFLWSQKRHVLALILICIACLIHFSLLYYSLLVFPFIYLNIKKSAIPILILTSLIIYEFVIRKVQGIFMEDNMYGSGYFGDGEFGRNRKEAISINGWILYLFNQYINIPLGIFLYKIYDKKDVLIKVSIIVGMMIIMTLPLSGITGRTSNLFSLLSALIFIRQSKSVLLKNRKLARIITACYLLAICFHFYSFRGVIAASNYKRLSLPVVYVLTQHYDNSWILRNVNSDGDLKKQTN